MGFDNKESIARELVLLADNDYDVYKSRVVPITENLERKLAKGTFNVKLASKLVKYLMDDVAKKYAKHYVGSFTPGDRRLASDIWVEEFLTNRNHKNEGGKDDGITNNATSEYLPAVFPRDGVAE